MIHTRATDPWGEVFARSTIISRNTNAVGPQSDPRFTLHHCQPRADKLDARQRKICRADPAFAKALELRVASKERFAAFLENIAFYIALDRPCLKCGSFKKRTRDRSCYGCHLSRSKTNFERMKAGIPPVVARNRDSHLDLLARVKAEREDDFFAAQFGQLSVKRYPTGRLEVIFPDGHCEPDLSKCDGSHVQRLVKMLPELQDALIWAGWY